MKNILLKHSTLKRGLKGLLSTNFSLQKHAKAWAQERTLSANFSLSHGLRSMADHSEGEKPGLYGLGKKKGFGLLEVMISSVIIIMILVALVFIGRSALNNNQYLSQRSQAIYLAQEGIEMVRQIRDTNWTDGDSNSKWDTLVWNGSDFVVPTSSRVYKLEYISAKNRMLLQSQSGGEVITVGGIQFTRKITVEDIGSALPTAPLGSPDLAPYAKIIKSNINWNNAGQPKTIEISELLTNWRPDF